MYITIRIIRIRVTGMPFYSGPLPHNGIPAYYGVEYTAVLLYVWDKQQPQINTLIKQTAINPHQKGVGIDYSNIMPALAYLSNG